MLEIYRKLLSGVVRKLLFSLVKRIVQFRIKKYRWIQILTAHLYRVSLDIKVKYSEIPASKYLKFEYTQETEQ